MNICVKDSLSPRALGLCAPELTRLTQPLGTRSPPVTILLRRGSGRLRPSARREALDEANLCEDSFKKSFDNIPTFAVDSLWMRCVTTMVERRRRRLLHKTSSSNRTSRCIAIRLREKKSEFFETVKLSAILWGQVRMHILKVYSRATGKRPRPAAQ